MAKITFTGLYKIVSGQDHFCSGWDHFFGTGIRLLVANITFVSTEINFKVNVIASSVDKIRYLWPRSLLLADIRLLVVKITIVVAEITFKVVMSTTSVAKIIFIVAEITFKVVKITFVVT